MKKFVLADAHAPRDQYDVAFVDEKRPPKLTKDDSIVYVEFGKFAYAIGWLMTQEHTASFVLRNGDCGLEQNEFCYYFTSGATPTNFMFWDDLLPPNLNYVYVQNLNIDHPKFRVLPLGVLSKHGQKLTNVVGETHRKDKLCYANFATHTYLFRSILTRGYLAQNEWITYESDLDLTDYYRQLASSEYVLCPRGNGHDSFRVWESLILGAFPVVTRSVMWTRFSNFLPILVVDHWNEVTEELLSEKRESLEQKKAEDWSMMFYQPFWNNHVKNQRHLIQVTSDIINEL